MSICLLLSRVVRVFRVKSSCFGLDEYNDLLDCVCDHELALQGWRFCSDRWRSTERRIGGTVEFVMIPPRRPTRSGAGSSSMPLITSSRYDGISFATFDVIFLVLGRVRNVRARTRGTQGGQENVMSSYSSKLYVLCHYNPGFSPRAHTTRGSCGVHVRGCLCDAKHSLVLSTPSTRIASPRSMGWGWRGAAMRRPKRHQHQRVRATRRPLHHDTGARSGRSQTCSGSGAGWAVSSAGLDICICEFVPGVSDDVVGVQGGKSARRHPAWMSNWPCHQNERPS